VTLLILVIVGLIAGRLIWRSRGGRPDKALHGSARRGATPPHLLAVLDHTTRALLGRTDVDTTSNQSTQFRPLLDRLDLGRVSRIGG
jgi:hypothetical protein